MNEASKERQESLAAEERAVRYALLIVPAMLVLIVVASLFLWPSIVSAAEGATSGDDDLFDSPAHVAASIVRERAQEATGAPLDVGANAGADADAGINEAANAEAPESLVLVNRWNPVPETLEPSLVQLDDGHAVDAMCYPELQEMMDDCRAEGLSPVICSSYRTIEMQQELFDKDVQKRMAQGYSWEDACEETSHVVAIPRTSEHHTGLAVDIIDASYSELDEGQANTLAQRWLIENSWRYGFIMRYPDGKSDITGIIYEPWHYRYVGREAAKEIHDKGVCLEEYLGVVQG